MSNEHRFEVLINGTINTYNKFEDIPMVIENIISFAPSYIPPPHTEKEHLENSGWMDKFKELKGRETK